MKIGGYLLCNVYLNINWCHVESHIIDRHSEHSAVKFAIPNLDFQRDRIFVVFMNLNSDMSI